MDILLSFSRRFYTRKIEFFVVFNEKYLFSTTKNRDFFRKNLIARLRKPLQQKSGLYSSIHFHFLFRMVKTEDLHLIPVKSYSKNTHPSSFLKCIIECCFFHKRRFVSSTFPTTLLFQKASYVPQ